VYFAVTHSFRVSIDKAWTTVDTLEFCIIHLNCAFEMSRTNAVSSFVDGSFGKDGVACRCRFPKPFTYQVDSNCCRSIINLVDDSHSRL